MAMFQILFCSDVDIPGFFISIHIAILITYSDLKKFAKKKIDPILKKFDKIIKHFDKIVKKLDRILKKFDEIKKLTN